MLDDVGVAADSCGDDRKAAGHGFEEAVRRGLAVGRQHEDVHFPQCRFGHARRAAKLQRAVETERVGPLGQLGARGTVTPDHETTGRVPAMNDRGGFDEVRDALFWAQIAERRDSKRFPHPPGIATAR